MRRWEWQGWPGLVVSEDMEEVGEGVAAVGGLLLERRLMNAWARCLGLVSGIWSTQGLMRPPVKMT